MSLRWDLRLDRYQRGDERIRVFLRKIIGQGYALKVTVDYFEDTEDGYGPFLCADIVQDWRLFESKASSEMFISRLKKQLCFSVDGLIERTYYFGSQNSHYEKE